MSSGPVKSGQVSEKWRQAISREECLGGQRGGQGSKGGAALSPRRWHLPAALTGVWWENKNKRTMQIKVFTIPVLGGERANEELNTFLRSKRVLQETFTKPSRIHKRAKDKKKQRPDRYLLCTVQIAA